MCQIEHGYGVWSRQVGSWQMTRWMTWVRLQHVGSWQLPRWMPTSTGAQLVGGGGLDLKVGILNLRECHGGVVRQSADIVSCVAVVVAVTSEGGVLTQNSAVLLAGDAQVHGVRRLQELAPDLGVLTQLGGVIDAVDLKVVHALLGGEPGPSSHRVAVHSGQLALSGLGPVHCGPGVENNVRIQK